MQSDSMHVATRKGLFVYQRSSGGWSITGRHFLADNVTLSLVDRRDGHLYAALDHGHFGVKVHRSADGGASWQEVAAPTYPEKPADDPDGFDWSLQLIWALEAGGPDEEGVLWCGTIPGGLFRSADRGDSWKMIRSLWDEPQRRDWFGGGADQPGIHSISIDPRDPAHLMIGVSCGGVWVTTDGGATWRVRSAGMWADYMPPERREDPAIQDPHRLARCRSAPDHLWVQHHNGIFRSTDGAATWTEVTTAAPSSFGFAVVVHPERPETAWFVPAASDEQRIPVGGKVVVSRTTDGGETFEVLDRGLPGVDAYDLTFRHALDIDSTGERLAFGTTTGNLFVSEDGGDSWQAISHHLPPVYAVRFA